MLLNLSNQESDLIFHLEKAMEEEEILVFYQPIIHTISGSLCGFEALSRWNHPEFGLLPPAAYIEALERTRQAYRLDCYIIEKVCQRYAAEVAAGHPVVPFSINLSRKDFEMMDMFEYVKKCTEKYRIPVDMLNIEITETAFSDEGELLNDVINQFRVFGYQVWMDDFGSGYSSLNTLKDYEFDELKIDMRFLSDTSIRSRKIIASIVSMAKNINMITLAEGVETDEQVKFLRSIGCDRLQGYYFCKPRPYEDVVSLLEEKGISFESKSERGYYHAINRINLLSPSPFEISDGQHEDHEGGIPLCILESRKGHVRFLYKNEEFDNYMRILGSVDAVDMIQKLTHFGIMEEKTLNRFTKQIRQGEMAKVNFKLNGDYCSAKAKCISISDDRYAILLSMTNITRSMEIDHEQVVNQSMRNIYSMYLRVSVMHLKEHTVTAVFEHSNSDVEVDKVYNISQMIEYDCAHYIHPEDQKLYCDFINPDTLEERIFASKDSFINVKLRTLDGEESEYTMKMYIALAMGNHEVMILVRHAHL